MCSDCSSHLLWGKTYFFFFSFFLVLFFFIKQHLPLYSEMSVCEDKCKQQRLRLWQRLHHFLGTCHYVSGQRLRFGAGNGAFNIRWMDFYRRGWEALHLRKKNGALKIVTFLLYCNYQCMTNHFLFCSVWAKGNIPYPFLRAGHFEESECSHI